MRTDGATPMSAPSPGLCFGVVIEGHASYSRASLKRAATTPWASGTRAQLAVILSLIGLHSWLATFS